MLLWGGGNGIWRCHSVEVVPEAKPTLLLTPRLRSFLRSEAATRHARCAQPVREEEKSPSPNAATTTPPLPICKQGKGWKNSSAHGEGE